jgi:hypothetical protein
VLARELGKNQACTSHNKFDLDFPRFFGKEQAGERIYTMHAMLLGGKEQAGERVYTLQARLLGAYTPKTGPQENALIHNVTKRTPG